MAAEAAVDAVALSSVVDTEDVVGTVETDIAAADAVMDEAVDAVRAEDVVLLEVALHAVRALHRDFTLPHINYGSMNPAPNNHPKPISRQLFPIWNRSHNS